MSDAKGPFYGYYECGCIDVQDEQRRCVEHARLPSGPREPEWTPEALAALRAEYDAWLLKRQEKESRVKTLGEALTAIQSQCAGHADEFSQRVWNIAEKALNDVR